MRNCSHCGVSLTADNQAPSDLKYHGLRCKTCREVMRRERRRQHVRRLYANSNVCEKCGKLLTPKTGLKSNMEAQRFLCKDCDLDYQRRYYHESQTKKERLKREYFQDWYLKHRGEVKSQYQRNRLENEKQHVRRRIILRQLVFNHYGWKCSCCGEGREEFLCLDHIKGGGNRHKKTVHHLYQWIVKNNFPEGFRTLCFNCNFTLGHRRYCPHQQEKLIHPIGHDRLPLMEVFS